MRLSLSRAREGDFFGGAAGGASARAGHFDHEVAEGVLASAAVAADAASLELLETVGAALDGPSNIPIRHSAADTDDHVRSLSMN